MSEDKKSLIDLVPDSIDNAVKNITDKPTQNMGTTLADIWYLVFGGISQAAEKRKLKYTYALQEFENELKEKISKIPEDKRKEPDIQITAKALEEAKYCIDKEELRNMFSSLIASSMNTDRYVSPILINIVSSLTPMNAKILEYYYDIENKKLAYWKENSNKIYEEITIPDEHIINIDKLKNFLNIQDHNIILDSIRDLEHFNLICSTNNESQKSTLLYQNLSGSMVKIENTHISILGYNLCKICSE